jgi:hypothetical protein
MRRLTSSCFQPLLREVVEVVEIAPSPPWLVEGVDLPALQDGYLPWE